MDTIELFKQARFMMTSMSDIELNSFYETTILAQNNLSKYFSKHNQISWLIGLAQLAVIRQEFDKRKKQ